MKFDYICSGYLGSIQQIDLVASIKDDFLTPNGKFIVDPVMGDGGKLYSGFTPAYVEKMKELCSKADFILPNVTEACYLADMPYPLKPADADEVLARLKTMCPCPIVTGIEGGKELTVAYINEIGHARTYVHENIEGAFHGAGDVFAAAFVGALARGKSLETAIELASNYTAACIKRAVVEVPDKRYGLPFEAEIFSFLKKLNG